jgi:hypothetical protein
VFDPEEIKRRFQFHAGNDVTIPKHENVRHACGALAEFLIERVPDGRELALALTNLEQVMFWANAAIARVEGGKTKGEADA